MTNRDRLYRMALLAYPRAYRASRGDEVVATMHDASDAFGGRVRWGDLGSVALAGLSQRVRSLGVAPSAVAGAMVALAIAMLIQLSGPSAFAATSTVEILPRISVLQFESDVTSPQVLDGAARMLGVTDVRCAVHRIAVTERFRLSCVSGTQKMAPVVVESVVSRYDDLVHQRALRAQGRQLATVGAQAALTARHLATARIALASAAATRSTRIVRARELRALGIRARRLGHREAYLQSGVMGDSPGFLGQYGSPTVAAPKSIGAGTLAAAAALGAAIGALLSTSMRSRRGRFAR